MSNYIHSYTSLADYAQCPRLFKRKHIDKAIPFVETAATKRGNRLHKQMEDVFAKGGGIPYEFKGNKKLVELLHDRGARAEVQVGITRDGRGCNFFDKKHVWLRGKVDLYAPIVSKGAAIMVDWKSGNPNYTDEFQAHVYNTLVSTATRIQKVLFLWGYFSGEMPYLLTEGEKSRRIVHQRIAAVEADEDYAPTPCWKCRFCPVEECEYNRSDE